jgi:hypothetical protein
MGGKLRNLEAPIAANAYVLTKRNADHLSYLLGRRKPKWRA